MGVGPLFKRCLDAGYEGRALWKPLIEEGKTLSQAIRGAKPRWENCWSWTTPSVAAQYAGTRGDGNEPSDGDTADHSSEGGAQPRPPPRTARKTAAKIAAKGRSAKPKAAARSNASRSSTANFYTPGVPAKTTRRGIRICEAFNCGRSCGKRGACVKEPAELHICNFVSEDGKLCGSGKHGRHNHS